MKATQENTDLDVFFASILKLKTVKRQGWKDKLGLKHPESVADHCFSMTAIAMVLSDIEKLDTAKLVKMSLLHDLAESLVGDITPDQMSKSAKRSIENAAMLTILRSLDKRLREKYWKIWQEYQSSKTEEAKFLHQIDKFEMALQAKEYHKLGYTKKQILPFIKTAKLGIRDKTMKRFLKDI